MANNIEFAQKYQSFLDEELLNRSYAQWMQPNEDRIQYDGGKQVKIAQIDVSGLGNYDANNAGGAYPKGNVSLKWVAYDMEMDRAVQFQLGRITPSDSGWMATTENVTRTFGRKQLVKEQDIFRFNRVYSALKAKTKYSTHIKTVAAAMTADELIDNITELYLRVKEDSNEDQDFVAFLPMVYEGVLRKASKTTYQSITFDKSISINGVEYRCVLLNNLPLVFVPSDRLQTVIKINDGRTDGQEVGGIVADTTSKQVELLMMSSDAVAAVGKIDSLKVFSCDEQQASDETTINYHYLYDCWIFDNYVSTVAAVVRQ